LGGLSFGSSHFTFSLVVAVFVLCIAFGSFAVTAFRRIPPRTVLFVQTGLVVLLALLYLPLQDSPYWAYELRQHFGYNDAAFYFYYVAALGCMLAVLGLPIGLSGAMLPLLFHALNSEVGEAGFVAGRLYAWNTLGSVAGALLGGYVLLFWLDLHQIYRISVAVLAVGAGLLAAQLLSPRWAVGVCGGLAVVVVMLSVQQRWSPLRLSSGPFRRGRVATVEGKGPDAFFRSWESRTLVPFYDDDPTSSVAVWENQLTARRAIITNGKSDGEIPTENLTTTLCAILPALFTNRNES